jgi:hypothetical protein
MSWLLHPITPFILDGVAGLVAGILWRIRGTGAAAAAVMIGAGLVALATLAAHRGTSWGEPDGITSRVQEEGPRGTSAFHGLTVLVTDLVFNLIVATIVAGLTCLALRTRA